MDPKNNANPTAPDEQNTTPQDDAQQDAMPSLGNETVQGTDVGNGRPEQSAPETEAEVSSTDAVTPSVADASTEPEPPKVAIDTNADADSGISGEPPATPTDTTTPSVPTDVTAMPSAAPADQQVPSEPVPPMAPTPTASNDKKTIMILGVVAAVLLVAIAVLYFVV